MPRWDGGEGNGAVFGSSGAAMRSPPAARSILTRPRLAIQVAAAVQEWANDKGASVYTHWFQPMGSTEVRLGMSGQVHNGEPRPAPVPA